MTKSVLNFRLIFIITAVFVFTAFSSTIVNSNKEMDNVHIIFPRGLMVNIGQVGWMIGSPDGDTGGPWRAGIRRNFEVRDYKPIVEIGKEVGVRFMTLFIMGEFDRLNVLAEYPTSNPQGRNWDNSDLVSKDQIDIMKYVKNNAANMEFGITGVLHEYWEDGNRTRAEWYNVDEQKPRDENIIRKNVELLKRLMAQYGITPENGHSYPESFIAYGFYFNPDGNYSLGKVLSDNGVKYANTPYATIHGLKHPPLLDGDFDHGVLLLDRFNHGNLWYEYAKHPPITPDEIRSVIVESHWANWLAYDDHLQPDLNKKWIEFLKSIQAHNDHYLAKNTEQVYSQWLYKKYTKVEEASPGRVRIDNTQMHSSAYNYDLLGNMVLAIKLGENEHVSHASLDGNPVAAYFADEGFGYIYLPPLQQKNYVLEYKTGIKPMERFVNNTGTYNIYSVINGKSSMEISMKMYGTQTVKIHSPKPKTIESNNEFLKVLTFEYDEANSVTHVEIEGRNIQGERGTITLRF